MRNSANSASSFACSAVKKIERYELLNLPNHPPREIADAGAAYNALTEKVVLRPISVTTEFLRVKKMSFTEELKFRKYA